MCGQMFAKKMDGKNRTTAALFKRKVNHLSEIFICPFYEAPWFFLDHTLISTLHNYTSSCQWFRWFGANSKLMDIE